MATTNNMLEDAIYPAEFLHAFKETAFEAMEGYLKRTKAPKEVLALLDDLNIMANWEANPEKDPRRRELENQFMIDTIASASRNIVAVGGVFYCPSGTTINRLTK